MYENRWKCVLFKWILLCSTYVIGWVMNDAVDMAMERRQEPIRQENCMVEIVTVVLLPLPL